MKLTLFKYLIPPLNWRLPVIILLGIFAGLSIFSIYTSKAFSYLSSDPATCVNCHIMTPQYASWFHGAHRIAGNCNDCHVPHNNMFNMYYFKAKDGMRHATLFTLRKERQVIYIGDDGKQVVQNNCIRCHENLITDSKLKRSTTAYDMFRKDRYCWDCHRETPHGRTSSLSSYPYIGVPLPKSIVPDWMKKKSEK